MSRFATQRKDFVAAAEAAWSAAPPAWVTVLAERATAEGLAAAGRRCGYSAATLSYVLANKYRGDLSRVEQAVAGAFMNARVMCPIVGEIGRDRCLNEQKRDDVGVSAARTRLYHKCRGIGTPRCKHSLIGKENTR